MLYLVSLLFVLVVTFQIDGVPSDSSLQILLYCSLLLATGNALDYDKQKKTCKHGEHITRIDVTATEIEAGQFLGYAFQAWSLFQVIGMLFRDSSMLLALSLILVLFDLIVPTSF